MYNQTNLAVAEERDIVFRFPDVDASADFSKEDMEDDIDGLHLSFPRAKIAGGGTTVFELPSDDASKPEHVGKLEGVILFHHPVNGYWVGDSADEDNAPLCTSMDGTPMPSEIRRRKCWRSVFRLSRISRMTAVTMMALERKGRTAALLSRTVSVQMKIWANCPFELRGAKRRI